MRLRVVTRKKVTQRDPVNHFLDVFTLRMFFGVCLVGAQRLVILAFGEQSVRA